MKILLRIFLLSCIIMAPVYHILGMEVEGKEKKVLVITGGHDFDEDNFFGMIDKFASISYTHVQHPNAHSMLKPDRIKEYDVVLLYDMPPEISEEAQKDFINMLKKGKGLIVLHHAFCSYDFWPEYTKIIGGRYHHYPWKKDNIEQPLSVYKHNVTFDIEVEDKLHPITRGVENFTITDETYGFTEILPTVYPLLSTKEPSSAPLVCWINIYKKSRVVTLTLGHDNLAWENKSFQKVLLQAIHWVARCSSVAHLIQ